MKKENTEKTFTNFTPYNGYNSIEVYTCVFSLQLKNNQTSLSAQLKKIVL